MLPINLITVKNTLKPNLSYLVAVYVVSMLVIWPLANILI